MCYPFINSVSQHYLDLLIKSLLNVHFISGPHFLPLARPVASVWFLIIPEFTFSPTFQPRWTSQVVWLPAFAWFPTAFHVKVRLVSLAFGCLEFISTLLPQPRLVSPPYTFHLLQLPRGANYFSLSMTWHFSSFVHASPNWNTFFPSL